MYYIKSNQSYRMNRYVIKNEDWKSYLLFLGKVLSVTEIFKTIH